MAGIDVSEIVGDADFQDSVTLIRRTSVVNSSGRNVLAESSSTVRMVVQPAKPDDLQRLPDSVRRQDAINVWYRGELSADADGSYPDIVVWNSKRYQVQTADPFGNWSTGNGYTEAICTLIEAGYNAP
jgi:hypothetical protein